MLHGCFWQSTYNNITQEKMLHSLSTNFIPKNLPITVATRSKSAFLDHSHPSSLVLSRPLSLSGRRHLCRRSSLRSAYSPNVVPFLDTSKSTKGLISEFIEMELEVREYEVNQFGNVNYPIYSSYIQHAHLEIINNKFNDDGCDYGHAQPLAVTNLSLDFIAPLKIREKFMLKVRVSHASVARMHFEHFIFKLPSYEAILEAKSCVVWLDENHRPIRMPPKIKQKCMEAGLLK